MPRSPHGNACASTRGTSGRSFARLRQALRTRVMNDRSGSWMQIVSEARAIDDTTMKVGLLMESAQVHQRLAEGQLEKLRAHTQDLDSVVRDEIRRTLVEELQMLTAETARATRALEKIRGRAAWRVTAASFAAAVLCALVPIAIARWAL